MDDPEQFFVEKFLQLLCIALTTLAEIRNQKKKKKFALRGPKPSQITYLEIWGVRNKWKIAYKIYEI